MQEEQLEQIPVEASHGVPIDLTKDEVIAFNLSQAKAFGVLKMQRPLTLIYALYIVMIAVMLVIEWIDTATVSWVLATLLVLTAAVTAVTLTLLPLRVRKGAAKLYDAGNIDNYYGEVTVSPQQIVKDMGEDRLVIPLDGRSTYIEDSGFMAFITASESRAIVLPARCVTAELAAAVRKAVFAEPCQIHRRVIKRMEAKATVPLAKRAFAKVPMTLSECQINYTPEELKKLAGDLSWKQFVRQLPTMLWMSLMVATLASFDSADWMTTGAWFVGMLLVCIAIHLMRAFAAKKQVQQPSAQSSFRFSMNERGLVFKPSNSSPVTVLWGSVKRAVERPDCVEFTCNGFQMLRIPKRCIDNMEDFKHIVDRYMKKEL